MESSTQEFICNLKRDHPGVPFLALGQTALWDEPVKAAWRRLLDRHYPEARLIAGIHDTDYFAKTTALVRDESPYAMMEHDDIRTRGLWSAAGELSALFGSEDVPTRAMYEHNGVPIDRLAASRAHDKLSFLSEKTAAWGWRGIVSTEAKQRIAHDVALSDFLPALQSQLRWGFDLSLESIVPENRSSARDSCEQILRWISEIVAGRPECRLGYLYENLLVRFYQLLLNAPPANLETTVSTSLFQFNRQTCQLPRFRFVELFLSPGSAAKCRKAYDSAVAGGGMYALAEFGPDALPFDIVVPGIGRGTLHVSATRVKVDLPDGNEWSVSRQAADLQALAGLLEDRFGAEVVLIGKAVSLVSMLAAEFLVVFHETASGYTDRTTAMNDNIRAAGIPLDLKPIVRIQYPTWDALAALGADAPFRLPAHLSRAFGATAISAGEFAATWRVVVDAQKEKLRAMREVRTIRSLLTFLHAQGDPSQCWPCLKENYERAQSVLTGNAASVEKLKEYITTLKAERHAMRRELDRLQARSGSHFRSTLRPLQLLLSGTDASDSAELRRTLDRELAKREIRFTRKIAEAQSRVRQAGRVIRQWRVELRRVERSPGARRQRAEAERIVLDAEATRLEHVRSALITTSGLPHTQARPTAWWIPMVDPSGAWFEAITNGLTARLERL